MNTMALVLWSALMAVFGLVTANVAQASELKVLTSVALTSVLDELAPVFEKTTGTKLKIDYNLIAAQRKRILEGESADVIILSRGAMQELQKLDKFAASDLVDVAGTPVSVAARAGVPKPDISTVDALKQTLLSARSIVYADPAKGGASGVYFARVLDRLGIAEQMQAKTILVPGAQAAEVVARGEAELGVAQGSEIVPVAGAQLVGPLPGEFASMTVFTAGIGAGSTLRAPASELITFLKGPEA
ncbi:MAG: substrate-binding domain-containing protein, partial [Hyphomicrobiaceae bacterium]